MARVMQHDHQSVKSIIWIARIHGINITAVLVRIAEPARPRRISGS